MTTIFPSEITLLLHEYALSLCTPRVILRRNSTALQTWCIDSSSALRNLIACPITRRFAVVAGTVVQVYHCDSEEPIAVIEGGSEGVRRIAWAGNRLAVWSDFIGKVTVWDLSNGEKDVITHIKPDCFSLENSQLAIVQRIDGKERICLRGDDDIEFDVCTNDTALISMQGDHIALADNPIDFQVYIYTTSGEHIASYNPASPGTPYLGLGPRSLTWHSNYLVIGGHDKTLRFLHTSDWQKTTEVKLRTDQAWQEPNKWLEKTRGTGQIAFTRADSVTSVKGKESGIKYMQSSGNYLAVVTYSGPNTVYLLFDTVVISAGTFNAPVTDLAWDQEFLAVAYGHQSYGLWDQEWRSIAIESKAKFAVDKVEWSSEGGLLCSSRDMFTLLDLH